MVHGKLADVSESAALLGVIGRRSGTSAPSIIWSGMAETGELTGYAGDAFDRLFARSMRAPSLAA